MDNISSFILESGFSLTKEDIIRQLVTEKSNVILLEMPIDRQLYFSERTHLVHQFLQASLVGEILAKASLDITCDFEEIDEPTSVVFELTPLNHEAFANALHEAAIPFMNDELASAEGYDDIARAEAGDGWYLLEEPESLLDKLRFPELVERARNLNEWDEDEDN